MPCSRCHQSGHNARNRLCPERQTSTQQDQINEENEELLSFLQMYENALPAFQGFEESRGHSQSTIFRRVSEGDSYVNQTIARPHENILYNLYLMPREFLLNRPIPYSTPFSRQSENTQIPYSTPFSRQSGNTQISQTILRHFINPATQLVCTRRVFTGYNCVTALGVQNNTQSITLLHGVEYPTNVDVYILIPQIPEVTIRGSPRVFQGIQPLRLASSYVKEWKIVHDLTRQVDPEQQYECVICIESKPATQFAKTNCQHEYCVDCIKSYVQSRREKTANVVCPMCRSELSEINVSHGDTCASLQDFIRLL
jgi:hypothetical protein